ncbi:MAG: hypothetical protein RLZZ116_1820 [Planctomycetota bacterium]|jgi:hypothetical protein
MVLMAGLKQATVQELAELSGRTAQSLYPHLEALVSAQFLVVQEPQETGKRSRTYVLGPAAALPPVNPQTGIGNSERVELAALMLHDSCARLRRYGTIAEGIPPKTGAEREHVTLSELTWLDDDRRARVNALSMEILQIIREGRAQRTGRRTNVIVYHFPDVTLREARKQRGAKR